MSGCLGVQLPLVWKMMTGCMHFNTVAHSDTHTQKLGVPGPQWQPKNPPISCTLQSQTLQTTSLRALPTISRDPLTRQGEHKRSHITYTVPEVNTHTYIYIYIYKYSGKMSLSTYHDAGRKREREREREIPPHCSNV